MPKTGYMQDQDPQHLETVAGWLREHAHMVTRIQNHIASASAYHYAGEYEMARHQVTRAWELMDEVDFGCK